ncbi:MAG: hypothetical protein H0W82_02225 [Actinobacteria bacterium]|nr:hypothetical protein [Actinomycetota bacterium]
MGRFQPTPRSLRDDAVMELVDLAGEFGVMRTALKRLERALDHCARRPEAAQASLRKAQELEDQLALWEPSMGDRRRVAVTA